ncbi:hypothetical protein GT347_00020 [Xylophilus rhododendri]|uniref:F-box domain-containing protein n=1 Tax=Xylophilus rhododendri TaxID=2697032 RepID=A0A857IYB1_9BURK|nr:hypothetical protein [Xylophilus rhododendri]QHI96524.1 hypothetical protein GT347_00020 [Xylophilus rhododendri]
MTLFPVLARCLPSLYGQRPLAGPMGSSPASHRRRLAGPLAQLEDLPNELLCDVFDYLGSDDLRRWGKLNRRLNSVVELHTHHTEARARQLMDSLHRPNGQVRLQVLAALLNSLSHLPPHGSQTLGLMKLLLERLKLTGPVEAPGDPNRRRFVPELLAWLMQAPHSPAAQALLDAFVDPLVFLLKDSPPIVAPLADLLVQRIPTFAGHAGNPHTESDAQIPQRMLAVAQGLMDLCCSAAHVVNYLGCGNVDRGYWIIEKTLFRRFNNDRLPRIPACIQRYYLKQLDVLAKRLAGPRYPLAQRNILRQIARWSFHEWREIGGPPWLNRQALRELADEPAELNLEQMLWLDFVLEKED